MFGFGNRREEEQRSRRSQRGRDVDLLSQIKIEETDSNTVNGEQTLPALTFSTEDLMPKGIARQYALAQQYIEKQIKNVQSLEELLGWTRYKALLGPRNLVAYQQDSSLRNMKYNEIINQLPRKNMTAEVRKIEYLYRNLKRHWKNNGKIQMYIDIRDIDYDRLTANAGIILKVPRHNHDKKIPPFSSNLYYLRPESVCMFNTLDEYQDKHTLRGNSRYISLPNYTIQEMEERLWPEERTKDAFKNYYYYGAQSDLSQDLTLEKEQVSGKNLAIYLALATLGKFESDPFSVDITRSESDLR